MISYSKLTVANGPWGTLYGGARSVLALGTFLTLLLNHSDIIFFTESPHFSKEIMGDNLLMEVSIFTLLSENLELARYISLLLLAIVISGWRPRYTALFHWWISFSFFITSPIVDGGDQLTAVLTFLLIPVCLTDSRKSHWQTSQIESRHWEKALA